MLRFEEAAGKCGIEHVVSAQNVMRNIVKIFVNGFARAQLEGEFDCGLDAFTCVTNREANSSKNAIIIIDKRDFGALTVRVGGIRASASIRFFYPSH
jgi:hypothetical protein